MGLEIPPDMPAEEIIERAEALRNSSRKVQQAGQNLEEFSDAQEQMAEMALESRAQENKGKIKMTTKSFNLKMTMCFNIRPLSWRLPDFCGEYLLIFLSSSEEIGSSLRARCPLSPGVGGPEPEDQRCPAPLCPSPPREGFSASTSSLNMGVCTSPLSSGGCLSMYLSAS